MQYVGVVINRSPKTYYSVTPGIFTTRVLIIASVVSLIPGRFPPIVLGIPSAVSPISDRFIHSVPSVPPVVSPIRLYPTDLLPDSLQSSHSKVGLAGSQVFHLCTVVCIC